MGVQCSRGEALRQRFLYAIPPLDLGEGDSGRDKVYMLLDVLGNVILAAPDMVFPRWHVMENVILCRKQRFQFMDGGLKLEPSSASRDVMSLIVNAGVVKPLSDLVDGLS
jgi:hypothetical protein